MIGENMKTKVVIIESERGWSRKIDEIKEFDTYKEALAFTKEFNSYNDKKEVPDWYMVAEIID
jgi:hypothetical protein